MKTKIFIMITGMVMFSFGSCQKEQGIDKTTLDHADYDAMTDAVFEDVFSTADNASIIIDNMSAKGNETVLADSCPVITVTRLTANQWPKKVVVDYGTKCTGLNENVRSGKILIEVTGPRLETGSKRTVTFDNYRFNDIKVEGTKVLENKGNNTISEKLTDGKLTFPDGRTIERTVDHQRQWTAGILTKNIWDDECLVTGVASGKNRNGVEYTNTILTALQWKRACRFIVAGSVKMERNNSNVTVIMDYGTGECDAKAVVTRGDQTREILLRQNPK